MCRSRIASDAPLQHPNRCRSPAHLSGTPCCYPPPAAAPSCGRCKQGRWRVQPLGSHEVRCAQGGPPEQLPVPEPFSRSCWRDNPWPLPCMLRYGAPSLHTAACPRPHLVATASSLIGLLVMLRSASTSCRQGGRVGGRCRVDQRRAEGSSRGTQRETGKLQLAAAAAAAPPPAAATPKQAAAGSGCVPCRGSPGRRGLVHRHASRSACCRG